MRFNSGFKGLSVFMTIPFCLCLVDLPVTSYSSDLKSYININLDQCHDKVKGLRMARVTETCSLI